MNNTLVVVSHYNAWPTDQLVALLDQIKAIPAGCPFDCRVVVNQAKPGPLELPPRHADVGVLYRENIGYNIGAWDHGWRVGPPPRVVSFSPGRMPDPPPRLALALRPGGRATGGRIRRREPKVSGVRLAHRREQAIPRIARPGRQRPGRPLAIAGPLRSERSPRGRRRIPDRADQGRRDRLRGGDLAAVGRAGLSDQAGRTDAFHLHPPPAMAVPPVRYDRARLPLGQADRPAPAAPRLGRVLEPGCPMEEPAGQVGLSRSSPGR